MREGLMFSGVPGNVFAKAMYILLFHQSVLGGTKPVGVVTHQVLHNRLSENHTPTFASNKTTLFIFQMLVLEECRRHIV